MRCRVYYSRRNGGGTARKVRPFCVWACMYVHMTFIQGKTKKTNDTHYDGCCVVLQGVCRAICRICGLYASQEDWGHSAGGGLVGACVVVC